MLRLIEGVGERRPQVRRVERLDHRVDRHALADLGPSPIRRRQGIGVELRHELVERSFGVAVVVERAGAVRRAVGEKRVERVLGADGLGSGGLDTVEIGIDRAVEHHRPDVRREEGRVRRSELAAVREAHVRDGVLAEGLADAIEVVGRVDGRDVPEHRFVLLLARVVELLRAIDQYLVLFGRVRRRIGLREVAVEIVDAVDRRAAARSPRVPSDDVEAIADALGPDRCGVDDEVGAGHTRPARVHEERADALGRVPRGKPHETEVDRAALLVGRGGSVVVDRHREGRALDVPSCVRAVDPADVASSSCRWSTPTNLRRHRTLRTRARRRR